ncbi:MAG: hypothetical protein JWQ74_1837 [Marmoricola sp.]|nr:hypothetical protein [Marmoricola sp.]
MNASPEQVSAGPATGPGRAVVVAVLVAISVGAVAVRAASWDFVSFDYRDFLFSWFNQLDAGGGFRALDQVVGNYTPPYIYITAALTYLPMDSLHSIKLVSCALDFVLAAVIARFVWDRYRDWWATAGAYAAVLFAPTVVLNSSAWAQSDVIYTTLMLTGVYLYTREKPLPATVLMGLAFSFKLQFIFISPLLLVLWLRGRMSLRHFFLIPATYVVCLVPAAIAGRSISEMLKIYVNQGNEYGALSLYAPSAYAFLHGTPPDWLSPVGVLVAGVVVLASVGLLWLTKVDLDTETLVLVALYFTILVPFLLPHMHDRYFYPADMLALLYALLRPQRWYLPVLVIGSSLICYFPYLFNQTPLPIPLAASLMGVALLAAGYDLWAKTRYGSRTVS